MRSNAAALAGRTNVLSVSRQLLLLTLCSLYLRTSADNESTTTEQPLPEEFTTTEITEGPATSSEGPLKNNGTDLRNSSNSNRSRGAGPARFVLHTRALPWLQAAEACARAGQRLAVPRSAADALHLAGLLAAVNTSALHGTAMRDALHVGLNDIAHEGRWITAQGEALAGQGYGAWLSAGAANSPQRNCGALLAGDGRFVAQRCAAALAFACDPPPAAPAGKGDGYRAVRGLAMYKLHRPARSWAKAAATCAREGATLATPETAREAGLLAGMMARPQLRESGVFIGINDLAEEGDWRNYDGTQLSDSGYNSWAPGEPSGGRAENCGALLVDGHLADVPCSEPRAFYCRRPEAARAETASYAQSEGVEGSWRLQREGRDWVAALQLCARDNATLAVANSSREARALAAVFKDARATFKDVSDADHVHVGAVAWAGTGPARAVSGQPLGSSIDWYYYASRPDGGKDNCVKMDTSGRYHYSSCATKLAFICRKYS